MSRWPLRRVVKVALLGLLKALGVFWLTRRRTAHQLRIIGWHGLSAHDEHEYDDVLFMQPETFRRRLGLLQRLGATVLPLEEALQKLRLGALPALPVVLTIDDGWHTSADAMSRALADVGYPATLYVTTEYSEHSHLPVFDVATGYLLWAAQRRGQRRIDLSRFDPVLTRLRIDTDDARRRSHQALRHRGDLLDVNGRALLVRNLSRALGIPLEPLALRNASLEDLKISVARGLDVQLHTHHHRMPTDEARLAAELETNRERLRRATSAPLRHLCYPSGEFHREQRAALVRLGVTSATTCLPGFNHSVTDPLELRRVLDRDSLTTLEVEAELSGVMELWRALRHGADLATQALHPRKELHP